MQVVPQAPQFDVVVSAVSQPSAAAPLQLPQPELQEVTAQAPVAQVSVVFGRSQAAPHAPQFASVVSDVSHPLLGLPSQSPKPAAQTGAQAPPTQDVEPFAFVQIVPQAPQLLLVVVEVSQPFAAAPSQLPNPAVQPVITQPPVAHDSLAFASAHTEPHEPQLTSVLSAASQPSSGSPSQLPNPAAQVGLQAPPTHEVVPLRFVHAPPQAPQFATLVERFDSQPLLGLASQSP